MRLLADESVERAIVERLRQEGYETLYVAELEPGIDDTVVLQQANDLGAVLLTADKDFGELVFRQHLIHTGVLLYRLVDMPSRASKADLIASVIRRHGARLQEAFTVVTPTQLRIRDTPSS